nr:homeobox-leucine zipper protein HAT22-like isoform X1 [Tanacetum cinerariifolium]
MGFHGFANTEIVLELRLNSISSMAKNTTTKEPNPCTNDDHHLRTSLTLVPSSDSCRRGSGSPFSNASVKRERDIANEESEKIMENSTSDHDEGDGGTNSKKKLRLTKVQSGQLEEAFKLQATTLNPKQKQNLARDLNLRPRQVEVWFQNRRA